jgi:hypothetical protein
MVSSILYVTSIETAKLNVDKEEVNLSAFLDGLRSDFSASSGKQIELKSLPQTFQILRLTV